MVTILQGCKIVCGLCKIQIGAAVLNRTLGIGMCVRIVLLPRLLLQHMVLTTVLGFDLLDRWLA